MLRYIEELRKFVEISGFKNVEVDDVDDFLDKVNKKKLTGVEVQFFDARLVATWQHLYFAVLNAFTSFSNEQRISKSLTMEIMLYASAQRQIRKATEFIGIRPSSREIAVLILGEKSERIEATLSAISRCMGGEHDDSVLALTRAKAAMIQKAFKISEAELEAVMEPEGFEKALVDLVLERMALLSTQR